MTTDIPRDDSISQEIIKVPEFTRRKNRSQHILNELRDIVLAITSEMMIVYCSSTSREFHGYEPSELVNHRFTEFVHLDDADTLKRNLQASKDAKFNMVEMTGHFHRNGFFSTACITPVQATHTMEVLLRLKMENQALKQKLHALQEQQVEQQQRSEQGDNEIATASFMEESVIVPHVYTPSINISHGVAETLSLFTGLHYEMGERSPDISMGFEGELLNTSSGCGTTNSPEWRKSPKGPKTSGSPFSYSLTKNYHSFFFITQSLLFSTIVMLVVSSGGTRKNNSKSNSKSNK